MVAAALRGRFLQRGRSYFWIVLQQHDPGRGVTLSRPSHGSLRNAAAQRQKAPLDEQRLVVGVGCGSRGGQRRGRTNTPSTVPGWHHTHHFPSLFDQGEHAQDVGLLRSPAHPACGPGTLSSVPSPRPHLQAQTRPHIRAETENPAQRETQKGYESSRLRPGRTWDSLTRIRV